jgi:hypothetical protein
VKSIAKFPSRSQIMGSRRSSTVPCEFLRTFVSAIILGQVAGNGSHKNVLFTVRRT